MEKKYFSMAILLTMIVLIALTMIPTRKYKPKTIKTEIEPNKSLREAHVEMLPYYPMTEDDIKEEEYYDSLETLAICVEAEAGNQGLMGKRLVVDVILNRVDSPRFPNDIESVIYQRNQFSTSFDGGMDRVIEPSEETFEAVRMELEHRTDTKILFFTAGGFNPYCISAYKYGAHYFGY